MTTFIRFTIVALAAALLAAPRGAAAQDTRPIPAPNAFYVEAGGNGLLYSVNYDRLVLPNAGFRVGIGVLPFFPAMGFTDDNVTLTAVPVLANVLFGKGAGRLEVGAGATFTSASVEWSTFGEGEESASTIIPNGTIGYRYQRPEGGTVFRAGAIPLYIAEEWWLSVGVSFGRAF